MAKGPEMPNTAKDIILDAHEDRIQRLESEHSESSSQLAVLTQRVDAGFDLVADRIDSVLQPLSSKMETVVEQIGKNSSRLETLEGKARKRQDRVASIKKGLWAIFLLVAGAGAKFFFDGLK